MLDSLLKIQKNKGKRVGRGYGSGKGGHTTGRGTKGHKSRSGYSNPRPGFEGGSMPLSRRLPKLKGFSRKFFKNEKNTSTLTLEILNKYFKDNDKVNFESLLKNGIISKSIINVKVVNKGKLDKKLEFEGISFSKSAKAILEKSGCKFN